MQVLGINRQGRHRDVTVVQVCFGGGGWACMGGGGTGAVRGSCRWRLLPGPCEGSSCLCEGVGTLLRADSFAPACQSSLQLTRRHAALRPPQEFWSGLDSFLQGNKSTLLY